MQMNGERKMNHENERIKILSGVMVSWSAFTTSNTSDPSSHPAKVDLIILLKQCCQVSLK